MFQLSDRRQRMFLRPLSNENDKYLVVEKDKKSLFKFKTDEEHFYKKAELFAWDIPMLTIIFSFFFVIALNSLKKNCVKRQPIVNFSTREQIFVYGIRE